MNRYDCRASPPHVKAKRASPVNRAHMNRANRPLELAYSICYSCNGLNPPLFLSITIFDEQHTMHYVFR
jgi:hypothetical protein